jgi:hypothetical protein
MRFRLVQFGAPVCAMALACTSGHTADTRTGTPASGAGTPEATTAAAMGRAPDSMGVPAGYMGRTDDPAKSLKNVTYTPGPGGMWEVRTGTHDQNLSHIVYLPADTASGAYAITTEIDQIAGPLHPEAFGILFGGQDLAGPKQKYGYFLVRSDGTYSIKARDGATARTVVGFTPSANIPKADAAGRAQYPITVQVTTDSVRFMVDAKPVAALAHSSLPTNGIAGIRINHGLHLMVKPLVISR